MTSRIHHVKNLASLTVLVHHRWALPVLGELYRDDGAKFVTLVHRLNVSKDSLARTLEHLRTLDLAVKNPGYGHPLRPEYVLTHKVRYSARARCRCSNTPSVWASSSCC